LKWFLLIVIVIVTTIIVLVNNENFQRYLAEKVSVEATRALGVPVTVERIKLGHYLRFEFHGVLALDQQNDTLIQADQLKLRVSEFNTLSKVMRFSDVMAINLRFGLITHKGDTLPALTQIINNLSDTAASTEKPWQIQIGALDLRNGRFLLENRNEAPAEEGVDFNYLDLEQIDAQLDEFMVRDDTIFANIRYLDAKEKSGFIVRRMQSRMQVSSRGIQGELTQIVTPHSKLDFSFELNYNDYDAFSDFYDSVQFDATFLKSKLSMVDLSFFSPGMKPVNNHLTMQGDFYGRLSDMYARDIVFNYGDSSYYRGYLKIKGLPDTDNLEMRALVDDFYVTRADFSTLKLHQGDPFELPEPLQKLSYLSVQGEFEGAPDNFYALATLNTNLGKLEIDLRLKDTLDDQKVYHGHLMAKALNAGQLLGQEDDLGTLDLSATINGRGLDKATLAADVDGYINSLQFRGNTFDSIRIAGKVEGERFGGSVNIKDDLIHFAFNGIADFSEENAAFKFKANITDAYLTKLHLIDIPDDEARITTTLQADFTGNHVDSVMGEAFLSALTYHQDDFVYHLDTLKLLAQQQDSIKAIRIRSDFLDGNIEGDFYVSAMGKSFMTTLARYMPALYPEPDTLEQLHSLDFDFHFKDTQGLSHIFLPQLKVAPGTKITGNYNSSNADLQAQIVSDSVVFNEIRFFGLDFQAAREEGLYKTITRFRDVVFAGHNNKEEELRLGLERMSLENTFDQDSVRYALKWDDLDDTLRNKADIRGSLEVISPEHFKHRITHSEIMVNDSMWHVAKDNFLGVKDSVLTLRNLALFHGRQRVAINGVFSPNPEDAVDLSFDDFDVANFDLFLAASGISLEGIINGELIFSNLTNVPRFTGNLDIADLYFNNEKMGDMTLYSTWVDSLNALQVQSDIVYTGRSGSRDLLTLEGAYFPATALASDSLNFRGEIKNFSINTLQPFFDDFLSEMSGFASGEVNVQGSSSRPQVTGDIGLVRSGLRVSFLNTKYYLADNIILKPEAIEFDSIMLYDTLGNTALLNGKIRHQYFDDFFLDIHISPQKFAGLNTNISHNKMFYGTAFASGNVDITGPMSDISMSVKARPDENTNIVIPISTGESTAESDFITFIDKTEEKKESITFNPANSSGFNMDFQLDINPNARAEIILPFQMGNIVGRGTGNMRMEINSSGDFNMFGDYFIEEGVFIFRLQNILKNTFTIRRGATISWSGDPYDADINITAVYKARPSLKGLPAAESVDPELTSERVPVDCIITLKNKLFNPTIDFSIELPNADAKVRELVYSSIDTTNTAEMNKQMLYLLVLNSFSVSGLDNNLSSGFGAQSFELLSNQISSWLSQISKDVDIGINYNPGDSYTSEELEVALSTQLFDDRVSIDGNFGMSGMQERTNANNIVGDVNVEVKITRDGRFRIRAFNRTNNTELLAIDDPYTQGVGVFYRKEFDTLSELFRKKRSREANQ
jgi:hypothetical protein